MNAIKDGFNQAGAYVGGVNEVSKEINRDYEALDRQCERQKDNLHRQAVTMQVQRERITELEAERDKAYSESAELLCASRLREEKLEGQLTRAKDIAREQLRNLNKKDNLIAELQHDSDTLEAVALDLEKAVGENAKLREDLGKMTGAKLVSANKKLREAAEWHVEVGDCLYDFMHLPWPNRTVDALIELTESEQAAAKDLKRTLEGGGWKDCTYPYNEL